MTDLVFISLEHWDDIWRRNQFVCAELARRHPSKRILFVTPPRDLSNAFRRGKLDQLRSRPAWSPEGLANVVVSTPTKWLPNSLGLGRAVNARHLRQHIRREMHRLGIARPLLWINDHSAGSLVGTLGECGVVYDITDDWISFDQSETARQRVREQDERLCRAADAVIVCSERLRELKATLVEQKRLHVIPNGVDASHYAGVCDGSGSELANERGWAKPILGYTGTLHPDRIDVVLLEAVASRWTVGSIVLIGPNHLSTRDRERLRASGRVHLVGPVAYREIPLYMRAFDVCIVPHRVTSFTESLNPIKLWEYLASGKPIVSTPVAGFRDYGEFVALAPTADSFLDACSGLARMPPDPAPRRQAIQHHSWAARVDQAEAVCRSIISTRPRLVEVQPMLA